MKAYIFLILFALILSDSTTDYCIKKYYAPILNNGLVLPGKYSLGKCRGCINQYVGYGVPSSCKCVPKSYVTQCNNDPLCKVDDLSGICWKK